MKKIFLFLGLLGSLISCDKLFDDTPKCDDKEVVQLVEELGIPEENYWVNIYNEYYDDHLKFFKKLNSYGDSKLSEQLRKERIQYDIKNYGMLCFEIEDENIRNKCVEEGHKLYEEHSKKVNQEITENMDYIKNNYQTDAVLKAIYDRYYSPKISNIRPISSDKENKKCECEATLSNVGDIEKEVYYTAQKNTDGQIYIELLDL